MKLNTHRARQTKWNIDFKKINTATLPLAQCILRQILPGGRLVGSEYLARNPRREDRSQGSFKINTKSGRWADFATGDRGGDLVSLVAFIEGVSQREAARRLVKMVDVERGGHR
jgi:hypothetical protein